MTKKRKSQGTLHKFLGLMDYGPPRHFFLDWETKRATFTSEEPNKTAWKNSFHWKQHHREIFLSSSIPSSSTTLVSSNYEKSLVPLLKSHLQKCARRRLGHLCVKTTVELLALDPLQFFKRWCIILIEDGSFDSYYPILVWFMCAVSKGFLLPWECIEWLLGYVEMSSLGNVRLEFHGPKERPMKLDSKEFFQLHPSSKALILSFQLRKAFGGMQGDLEMLDDLTNALLEYYKEHGRFPSEFYDSMPVKPASLSNLSIHEWELAAVDFHVSDIIKKWKMNLEPHHRGQWKEEHLQEIMWHASAGINQRMWVHRIENGDIKVVQRTRNPSPYYESIWKEYSVLLHRLARKILETKYRTG